MVADRIRVKVFRYDPEVDDKPRYEDYEVPKKSRIRVLDVLNYIREKYDSSLTFRYSCRYYNKCGSCAVTINGTPGLACYEEAIDQMVIEPLKNFPILKDLAVSRENADRRELRIRPFFERAEPIQEKLEKIRFNEYEDYKELLRCMECWSCVAACPAVDVLFDYDKEFPGPGILVRLSKYAMDPRDSGSRGKTAFFEGVYDCTICGRCQEVCPWEINAPKIVIEKLRQIAVEENIGPLKGHQEFAIKAVKTGRTVDKTTKPLLEEISETITVDNPVDTIGFFSGCLADYRLQHTGKALLDLLKHNKVQVNIIPNQVCCGSPLIRTGQIKGAEE
ncbi:MAG: 2Fe-2S iron-sulfur cluster-binding protein, partial [Candidatus Hodarchaeota archaeon]